jgi:hypothetical protein
LAAKRAPDSHAHQGGFDLHVNVDVRADDRVLLEFARPWSDGTTHLLFYDRRTLRSR